MFTKHLALLPAAGLGLALLSDPAFADWQSAQQGLSEKAPQAVAATAKATRLAQKYRGKYQGLVNNVEDPQVGAGSAPRAWEDRVYGKAGLDVENIHPPAGRRGDLARPRPALGTTTGTKRPKTVHPGVYVRELPPGPVR